MEFVEAQRMMKSAPESDFARLSNDEAMGERIREWLDTPEGTMAHHPSWGHNLIQFKHDPLSPNSELAILIEMAISRKLPIDIDDITLSGVNVTVESVDLVKIYILHQFGPSSTEVRL